MGDGDITISAREVFDSLRALERRFDRQDATFLRRFDHQDAELAALSRDQKATKVAIEKRADDADGRITRVERRLGKIESWRTAVIAVWGFVVAAGGMVIGLLRPHFG